MLGIFNNNNPFNLIVLFVYTLLLRLPTFLYPELPLQEQTDGFLYLKIVRTLDAISGGSPLFYALVTLILVLSQAISLANVLNNQKLFARPTYVPAMAYVLITSLFPEWQRFSSALLVNSLMIWVWSQLGKLYNHSRPKSVIFNVSIAVGICSFLYFPALAFVLLILLALVVFRPFHISEWAVALVGVMTPFYFLAAWLYFRGQFSWERLLPDLTVSIPRFRQTFWAWGGMLLLILPFLVSGFYIQNTILRMLIQVRKSWSLMLIYLLITLLIPFVNATSSFSYWVLSAVPFAAFHAYLYSQTQKRWLPLVLHWLAVGFILALGYGLPLLRG